MIRRLGSDEWRRWLPLDGRVCLVLGTLTLFFCLFPLTVPKPGVPVTMKADEPAYLMMAQSLAFDGDLRLETADVERVFRQYPYRPVTNLIVMSDDGWSSVYYGKPYLYSLVAAPFVRLFGANGMVFLNMVMTFGMVWLGAVYLARFNRDGIAALFAAGFFLLSAGFAYVFWLHPEVFSMTCVVLAFFLGLDRAADENRRPRWAVVLSGVALAFAIYNKPMIAALGVPIVVAFCLRRRWRQTLLWLGGLLLGVAASFGLATALTGHPTPYLGVTRQGVRVCEEGTVPIAPGPGGGAAPAEERATGGTWSWIFRTPRIDVGQLAENSVYFLVGRHTGLVLYFPFAVLAAVFFLIHGRGDPVRWTLLAALAVVALFFLVFIPRNWQGGGGFVGNRYFVNLVPAFLFLATRVAPRGLLAAGFAAAGLFLGPLLFTPLGASQAAPTLQAHVRGAPFTLFPRELTLRELPGYEEITYSGARLIGRKDQVVPRGGTVWIRGADEAELLLLTDRELDRAVFEIGCPAPGNRVRISLGGDSRELSFRTRASGWEQQNVTLEPGGPRRKTHIGGEELLVYRLEVESRDGRNRLWTRHYPPNVCPGSQFAYWDSLQQNFYVGAAVTYLGDGRIGDGTERDVFAVRWDEARAPRRMAAGDIATIGTRLTNTSDVAWTASGAAKVNLSYHWRSADGEMLVFDGRRTSLPLPVAAGETVVVEQEISVPDDPGRYLLELDLVYEHVGWFSDRGADTVELPVRVVPRQRDDGAAPPTS